jgi:hypothetical protein
MTGHWSSSMVTGLRPVRVMVLVLPMVVVSFRGVTWVVPVRGRSFPHYRQTSG